MKAYSVTEKEEGNGAIFFAKHAIAAAIRGANEYADGELSGVSCRRAPWADRYAETRVVPVSAMVDAGWHFECHGCGVRIETGLPWDDNEVEAGRYEGWTPDAVIGTQHSAIFCDARCEQEHEAAEARRKAVEERIRATYRRILLRKLPGAQIEGKGHVYVTERHEAGRRIWHIGQVRLHFDFPGRKGGLGELSYREPGIVRQGSRGIGIYISAVDTDAFNAWRNGFRKIAA